MLSVSGNFQNFEGIIHSPSNYKLFKECKLLQREMLINERLNVLGTKIKSHLHRRGSLHSTIIHNFQNLFSPYKYLINNIAIQVKSIAISLKCYYIICTHSHILLGICFINSSYKYEEISCIFIVVLPYRVKVSMRNSSFTDKTREAKNPDDD